MANLTGTPGADKITGKSQADIILGLAGNDTLNGAGSDDRLFGGFGNDKSGSGADRLEGAGGNDFLDGEDGNDNLNGDTGSDTIVAGRGNDEIDGGSGNDRVMAAGTLDQYDFRFSSGTLRMTDEVAGRDGRDRIQHVEAVLFDDGYRLSLTGANNNPYAVADTAVTTERQRVTLDVLANDFDPDTTIFGKSSTLSLVSVGPTSHGGTATIEFGRVSYNPGSAFDFLDAGETATDTFSYTISDGKGGTFTTTATVTVTGTSTSLANLDGTNGFRLDGAAPYDFSGVSVASAGDVNGDGFDDVIIGATGADPGGESSGASYVVFGKAGGFTSSIELSSLDGASGFRLDGTAKYDLSGSSVASAGDLNGDGFGDLIVGAPGFDLAGKASGASYVVFGKAEDFASSIDLSSLDGATGFRLNGAVDGDGTGGSVASAGDLNGDGFDDLIVGAVLSDLNGMNSGSSYVVFGKAGAFASSIDLSSLDGATGFRLDGAAKYDLSGSVGSAGDVNGDGFDDLLIGASGIDVGGRDAGASYVVFGHAGSFAATFDLSDIDGTTGFRLDGGADDLTGHAESAGDVNGDGFDDLIIPAPGADPNGDFSGSSYVVFGKAAGFGSTFDLTSVNGANGFRLDGVATYDAYNNFLSVASAGDVNDDGFDDLLIGASGADSGAYDAGASYLVFGKAGGFAPTLDLASLNGTNGLRFDGVESYDGSGTSVASAGDVNGDGFDDLIIGAFGADPNGGLSGASYVVFGGATLSAARSSTVSVRDVLDVSDEAVAGNAGAATGDGAAAATDRINALASLALPHFEQVVAPAPIDHESGP